MKFRADKVFVAPAFFGFHVYNRNLGQHGLAVSLGKLFKRIYAFFGKRIAFYTGSSRREQKQCGVFFCPEPCNVSRMIARRGFGFIGVLLLLVNDDKADVLERSKHGRACSDNNPYAAVSDSAVFVLALAH